MTTDNLPAVPGAVAFKDRPDAVQVVSRSETAPPIIRKLSRVDVGEELVAAERDRYTALAAELAQHETGAHAGYDALGSELVLIDLFHTLQRSMGPVDPYDPYRNHRPASGQPAIAIARPWDKTVYERHYGTGERVDFARRYSSRLRVRGGTKATLRDVFYTVTRDGGRLSTDSWVTCRASVPPVPADVRRRHPELLSDKSYFLLWEADWQHIAQGAPRPPLFDPALIQQVAGSLFAVLAVWDLTPVEEAALRPGPT